MCCHALMDGRTAVENYSLFTDLALAGEKLTYSAEGGYNWTDLEGVTNAQGQSKFSFDEPGEYLISTKANQNYTGTTYAKTAKELKAMAVTLGENYVAANDDSTKDGYPILTWQASEADTGFELTVKVAPSTASIDFYHTSGYDENQRDILGTEIEAIDQGIVDGYHQYVLTLDGEGTVSCCGYDGDDKSLGGNTFDYLVDSELGSDGQPIDKEQIVYLRQVNFFSSAKIDNEYITADKYSVTVTDNSCRVATMGAPFGVLTGFDVTPVMIYVHGNANLYNYLIEPLGELAQL